ncbi:hypothetical protein GGR52DRAFT_337170 [Hypoxylon sp. FL1284]|nr:hypothetical protein GGR52DRAFT_337170 [Hypoxylon sp. FL1284]
MSARPSSSRGTSPKSSISNSFKNDKRISRDDCYVNSRAGHGAGFKAHKFTRGQLPTPESSPRSSPRNGSVSTLRMPTPDSLHDGRSADLGTASGSPTKPAGSASRPPQASLRYRQASAPSIESPASRSSTVDFEDKHLPKKQTGGKWKLFGRFGKKSTEHLHLDHHEQKGTLRPEHSQHMAYQPRNEPKMERSNTLTARGTPKHKPIVVRSQTMPYDTDDRKPAETVGRKPTGLGHHPSPSGGLLDIEIPDVTMERYSIMFGSVLKPQQQPQSQPSLLARRQATMQKLKTIDDVGEKEEDKKRHHVPRRTTSPNAAKKSPPLALFPPTPPQQPAHTAYRRSRSNTSPALHRSPSKASFGQSATHPRQASVSESKTHHYKGSGVHPNHMGKPTIATLARAREQQAALARESQVDPNLSSPNLDSPTDGLSSPELEVIKSTAVRPLASYAQEPKWQMVTPPQPTPSTASTSVLNDEKTLPSPASSKRSNSSSTSQEVDIVLDNSANMDPVALSIARQISVSRQQQKMLRPLQTGPAASRSRPSPSKTTPLPKIAMGANERYVETLSSTPTLVTPDKTWSSGLAQHRKSERVVLDEA